MKVHKQGSNVAKSKCVYCTQLRQHAGNYCINRTDPNNQVHGLRNAGQNRYHKDNKSDNGNLAENKTSKGEEKNKKKKKKHLTAMANISKRNKTNKTMIDSNKSAQMTPKSGALNDLRVRNPLTNLDDNSALSAIERGVQKV